MQRIQAQQCALGHLFAPAAAALIPRSSIKLQGFFPRDMIAKLVFTNSAQESSSYDDGSPHRTASLRIRSENEQGEGHQKEEDSQE